MAGIHGERSISWTQGRVRSVQAETRPANSKWQLAVSKPNLNPGAQHSITPANSKWQLAKSALGHWPLALGQSKAKTWPSVLLGVLCGRGFSAPLVCESMVLRGEIGGRP